MTGLIVGAMLSIATPPSSDRLERIGHLARARDRPWVPRRSVGVEMDQVFAASRMAAPSFFSSMFM